MTRTIDPADLERRVLNVTAMFLLRIQENGIQMSADQRVCESDAATLIGLQPGTLKNMRTEGQAPASYRAPVNGSRISYRVIDLAEWVERRREDW